jgi:hypothetical protein
VFLAWWRVVAAMLAAPASFMITMARLRSMAMTGAVAGADLGVVLAVGDVADVVRGFGVPAAADPSGELGGAGLAWRSGW